MSAERDRKLFIPCNGKDKGDWIKAAKASRMNLEDWVNKTLNEAVSRTDIKPPEWMQCFSQRTTSALMAAKIFSPAQLSDRVDEDTVFNIEGVNAECAAEIQRWYSGWGKS